MDEIEDILALARSSGVALWVDAQGLRFRAPAGAMTDQLRAALRSRKTEIIDALRGPVFVRGPQRQTQPIIEYHQKRWGYMKSGDFGIEFINSSHAAFRFRGRLNISALQSSVGAVATRHSILRARVVDTPEGPEFVLLPEHEIRLERIDLSGADAASREAAARSLATERIWKPFDMGTEPWFRIFAIHLSATEHVVGFVIHHFIADGWSVGIVTRELLQAYAAFNRDVPPALPDLPFQYFDYVAGMNEWIRSGAARSSGTYWREYLRNAPATRVPPDFDLDPETTGLLATESARLPPEVIAKLRAFGESAQTSMHAVVAAALIAVVAHLSKAEDIVLVSRTHGRYDSALFSLVGAFFDSMALRALVTPDMTFQTLATHVQSDLTRASIHQNYPYHLVIPSLQDIGASDIAPMLNFWDASTTAGSESTRNAQPFELLPRPPVKHSARRYSGFYVRVMIGAEGLSCRTEYLSLMYKSATALHFTQSLCRLLETASRNPSGRLSHLLADRAVTTYES